MKMNDEYRYLTQGAESYLSRKVNDLTEVLRMVLEQFASLELGIVKVQNCVS